MVWSLLQRWNSLRWCPIMALVPDLWTLSCWSKQVGFPLDPQQVVHFLPSRFQVSKFFAPGATERLSCARLRPRGPEKRTSGPGTRKVSQAQMGGYVLMKPFDSTKGLPLNPLGFLPGSMYPMDWFPNSRVTRKKTILVRARFGCCRQCFSSDFLETPS